MNLPAAVLLCLFAARPVPAAPNAPAEPDVIRGTVLETLDAGAYTYLKLKTAGGEEWAAVDQAALKKGDKAEVGLSAVMENFESPLLKRKFAKVIFGVLLSPKPKAAAHGSAPHGAGAADEAAVAPLPPMKTVARPAGPAVPVTIADLYARAKELKGKLVLIKGKVVKSNPNILGRTWLHLRDGSGSAAKRDNDITMTTLGTAKVDDQVTAEAVVSLDRDLGSGYAYPVILEDGVLSAPGAAR